MIQDPALMIMNDRIHLQVRPSVGYPDEEVVQAFNGEGAFFEDSTVLPVIYAVGKGGKDKCYLTCFYDIDH